MRPKPSRSYVTLSASGQAGIITIYSYFIYYSLDRLQVPALLTAAGTEAEAPLS
jgi:hypothetical protein